MWNVLRRKATTQLHIVTLRNIFNSNTLTQCNSILNKVAKKSVNITPSCSYCSQLHKHNIPNLLKRYKTRFDGIHTTGNGTNYQLFKIADRHYATSVKMSKTEATNKVPLAKTVPLRRQRKKTVEDVEDPPHHRNVVAYAVGEDLRLEEVRNEISLDDLYEIVDLPRDLQDVCMITAKIRVDGQSRDGFFFGDGSTAFWNMSESERHGLMKLARRHADNPYNIRTILREVEKIPVLYDKTTKLVKDTVHLKTLPEGVHLDETVALQKFAFSNALAQSVTLSVNECNLENFIEQLEPETQKLRDGEKSSLTKRDINMRLGEVFSLRHEINLESGFVDTPDIYWERDELESLYRDTLIYLSVPKRIRVLNDRLNYCSEILQLFNNQLNDEHHVRLEWIIIILILIEVAFECLHYAERFGFVSTMRTSDEHYVSNTNSNKAENVSER